MRPVTTGLLALLLVLPCAAPLRAADAAGAAREMAGVWLPDGKRSGRLPGQWPLTPAARQAADRYQQQYGPIDPTVDDANVSCIPESMPYPMRLIAQYPFEILFTPGRVTFFFEVYGSIRRVFLDPREAPADALPTAMGRSTGHWEGGALVIETTRIRRQGFGPFSGNPPESSRRRIIERLTLDRTSEGRKQLRNDITIEDPAVLTQPVTLRMIYKWSPDIEVGEYLCQQDIWDQTQQGSPSSVPWRK
jgi:hypothetical protein